VAKPKIQRRPVQSRVLVAPEGKGAASKQGNGVHTAMRLYATEKYVCSKDGISLRQLADLPEMQEAGVALRTLEAWCSQDRWAERRREFLLGYSRKIENEISTTLVRNRMAELKLLENMVTAMDTTAMQVREDGAVQFTLQPKSLESYVRTRLEIGERIDSLRQSIGDTITPQPQVVVTQQPTVMAERITIIHPNARIRPTDEEAYAMIDAMLAVREREQARRMAEYEATLKPDPYRAQLEAPKKKRPPPPADGDDNEDGEDAEA